jgi:hypothetical protein
MLVYRWNLTEVYRKSTEHATGPMYLRNFRGISSISADYHRQYLAKNSDGYCGLGGCGIKFDSAEIQYGS